MRKTNKVLPVAVLFAVLALVLAGCTGAPRAVTSAASCAFVVGDGQDGRDTNLHKVVYPGQNIELSHDSHDTPKEDVSYVYCNLRDYVVNNGDARNANNATIGDRTNPSTGYTDSGVQVKVSSTINWTVNQSPDAMKAFYRLCFKFTCDSSDDTGGKINSSTAGWNNMLGETFSFVVDKTVLNGTAVINDQVWQKHSPALYDQLASSMAKQFEDTMRPYTGYPSGNLFCGPDSAWKDPNNAGAKGNVFNCTNITVNVDDVERGAVSTTDGTLGAKSLNAQRLENARALYGANAPQVIARLDEIAACKAANTVCVFGTGADPAVPAGN